MEIPEDKVLKVIENLSKNGETRLIEYVAEMRNRGYVQEEAMAALDNLVRKGNLELTRYYTVKIPKTSERV